MTNFITEVTRIGVTTISSKTHFFRFKVGVDFCPSDEEKGANIMITLRLHGPKTDCTRTPKES